MSILKGITFVFAQTHLSATICNVCILKLFEQLDHQIAEPDFDQNHIYLFSC